MRANLQSGPNRRATAKPLRVPVKARRISRSHNLDVSTARELAAPLRRLQARSLMGWYVVFKEPSETNTQTRTVGDKDEALLTACDLHLRGKQVLCVGPFGRGARSEHVIEGPALRSLLRDMINK